jgi:hypothetical protein
MSDGELTKVIEQSVDPDLAEFASRLRAASGGAKLQTARPSPASSAFEETSPLRLPRLGDGSCFCSGASVCCRQGAGAIDCGFGLCGI